MNELDTRCQLVIVDGLPHCGVPALAQRIATALGVIPRLGATRRTGACRWLWELLEFPQPLVIETFHLTAAAAVADPRWETDLTAPECRLLDDAVARRFGRLIYLVDTPTAIEARIQESSDPEIAAQWPRPRLGAWLQHMNKAYSESTVARRGSYTVRQFLAPDGATTPQFEHLIGRLRQEMMLDA